MINRIFIIGDSFCDGVFHPKQEPNSNIGIKEEEAHWVNHVDWYYKDTEVINDAF